LPFISPIGVWRCANDSTAKLVSDNKKMPKTAMNFDRALIFEFLFLVDILIAPFLISRQFYQGN
jgi:hypothetical protein